MANDNISRTLDRRSFLRGSALFAGALGLSARASEGMEGGTSVPPQQNPQKPTPEEKPKEAPKQPEDPFADGDTPKDGRLIDKEGREYKICPQCGYNMYKQGKMWICENCGYSYVE